MPEPSFTEYGLPAPPPNGNPFEVWQAQVDLIILRRLSRVEELHDQLVASWRASKVGAAVLGGLVALGAGVVAIVAHLKGS